MIGRTQTIRIVIADDHPIFRDGIRSLIEVDSQFRVVGEASDGQEAIDAVVRLKPDVLLLDLCMPRMHGMQAMKTLAECEPGVRIIVLAAEIEKKQILQALLLGASGLVSKDTPADLFFKAIRTVMGGEYWIRRDSVKDLIQTLRQFAANAASGRRKENLGLTRRELEIVRAVAEGDTNKDIAQRLAISEQTVKHHLTSIFGKVGVSQRVELAMLALRNGWTEPYNPQTPGAAGYRPEVSTR